MRKEVRVAIEEGTLRDTVDILGQIGLDIQSVVNMMCKRIANEGGIGFLLPHKISKLSDEDFATAKRMSNIISPQMRDIVWECFKQYRKRGNHFIAKVVNEKSGMTQGSAFIYSLILDNMLLGKENTRMMKFADLVYYLNRIKDECPRDEYSSAIHSLKISIPYWRNNIPGNYGNKVSELVGAHE
ncbi:MAG: hypothetical protein FWE31_03415 [Firmicutes bacterium]|nr:hypothetical protein [Bacillota bacterium]